MFSQNRVLIGFLVRSGGGSGLDDRLDDDMGRIKLCTSIQVDFLFHFISAMEVGTVLIGRQSDSTDTFRIFAPQNQWIDCNPLQHQFSARMYKIALF